MSLTTPIDSPEKSGEILYLPVAASTTLYAGGLIAKNAGGYAVPAADTAGLVVVGRAENDAYNASGADGDVFVNVKRGVIAYANSATNPVAIGDLLSKVFVEDDATISKMTTHSISAGINLGIDPDTLKVFVDTRRSV